MRRFARTIFRNRFGFGDVSVARRVNCTARAERFLSEVANSKRLRSRIARITIPANLVEADTLENVLRFRLADTLPMKRFRARN